MIAQAYLGYTLKYGRHMTWLTLVKDMLTDSGLRLPGILIFKSKISIVLSWHWYYNTCANNLHSNLYSRSEIWKTVKRFKQLNLPSSQFCQSEFTSIECSARHQQTNRRFSRSRLFHFVDSGKPIFGNLRGAVKNPSSSCTLSLLSIVYQANLK